jgi:hypothetical protein
MMTDGSKLVHREMALSIRPYASKRLARCIRKAWWKLDEITLHQRRGPSRLLFTIWKVWRERFCTFRCCNTLCGDCTRSDMFVTRRHTSERSQRRNLPDVGFFGFSSSLVIRSRSISRNRTCSTLNLIPRIQSQSYRGLSKHISILLFMDQDTAAC